MSSSIQTPYNLLAPYGDAIADLKTGMATNLWDLFFRNVTGAIQSIAGIQVSQFGADFSGNNDSTSALQQAVNTAKKQGGGVVLIDRPGTLSINTVSFPAGTIPILLQGLGQATTIKRRGNLAPGKGLLDVLGSNVAMRDFVIDGATTKPVGLMYGAGFSTVIEPNDPMAPSLSNNTSIWVHGNTSMVEFQRILFQHSGGYSLLIDALLGDIHDVDVLNCWFLNNRPTLFGSNPGNLIYGSWNGGLLIKSDGRTAGSGVVDDVLVSQCRFRRNTGNCLWSHGYGITRLNSNFRWLENRFTDCGLDAIEVGCVTGGVVSDNVLRRIGYITLDDTSQSTPRWLAGDAPTAIDSAGVVKGVNYSGNSITSPNGGSLDLDGHGLSSLNGNVCRVPFPNEPEYAEDQIAITGPNNNGSQSYGVNLSNTTQSSEGAAYVDIVANNFTNLRAGSLRLYAARYVMARGNNIWAPPNSLYPPVIFGPIGPAANQRCYGNRVAGNHIYYVPVTGAPAVAEDDSISAFIAGEINFVYDNIPYGGITAFEFTPSIHSGSVASTYFPPTLNYIALEIGANNAIACAAGSGSALIVGLVVSILLAHTLQAGANTFAYNAGIPASIVSHLNPASNIATGYPVGATVQLQWNGTTWADLSQ